MQAPLIFHLVHFHPNQAAGTWVEQRLSYLGKGRGGRGEVLEYKAGAYLAAAHLIGGNEKAT